jgi:hypothetical protein
MRSSAHAGWAAHRRQAAATVVSPAHRGRPLPVWRQAASPCGLWPQRPGDRSASTGTSRTPGAWGAMGQCPRPTARPRAASARAGARRVTPATTCAARSGLCADARPLPGHSWRPPRPVTVASQPVTRLQPARRAAPGAPVPGRRHRAGRRRAGRAGPAWRPSGPSLGRVVLASPHRIAPRRPALGAPLALPQPRRQRPCPALEPPRPPPRQAHCHRVGRVRHRLWGEGEAETRPQRGPQRRPWRPRRRGRPPCLALASQARGGVLSRGPGRPAPRSPGAERGCHLRSLSPAHPRVPGRRPGRRAGKAPGWRPTSPRVTPPLRPCRLTPVPPQPGTPPERQERGQRVPFPWRPAAIRQRGPDRDERTRLCSHGARSCVTAFWLV